VVHKDEYWQCFQNGPVVTEEKVVSGHDPRVYLHPPQIDHQIEVMKVKHDKINSHLDFFNGTLKIYLK
jgi:hypothetical protein